MNEHFKLSENDARRLIEENHHYFYDVLRQAAKIYGKKFPGVPEIQISDAVYNACGQYNPATNVCKYSLPYAVYAGESYREIVAHEVTHAFTGYFENSSPMHGKTFLYLLRDVCGFKSADAFHRYSPRIVREVSETLAAMRGGYVNERSLGVRHGSLAAARNSLDVVRSRTLENEKLDDMKQFLDMLRSNPEIRIEFSNEDKGLVTLVYAFAEVNGERLKFSQTQTHSTTVFGHAADLIFPAIEDMIEDLQRSIEGYKAEHESGK